MNTSRFRLFAGTLLLTALTFALYQHDIYRRNQPQQLAQQPQWLVEKKLVTSGTKTIFIYEPFWGFELNLPWGKTGFIHAGCPVNDCMMTSDENALAEDEFDAVLFHIPTFRQEWKLRRRKPHQMFIFMTTEPPKIYGMPKSMEPFDGFFNRTLTYLRGADFYFPYGRIEKLASAPSTEAERLKMMRNVLQPHYNPANKKSGLAVFMASTCETPSNRLKYVEYLQKYMTVDISSKGGKCGGREICPRNDGNCFDYVEMKYKFYLSFENSICDQYVTEKFYNFMARNIVPVVLGGANYSAIAPPHSYINAMDYTPKQLAEYLLKLDKNDSLYAEYFWWKPHYRVFNPVITGQQILCDLCANLHTQPIQNKTVYGLQNWYYTNSQCIENPTFDPN